MSTEDKSHPLPVSIYGDLSRLFSGMFSDELDLMGFRHQVETNWRLNSTSHKLYGKVRTVALETMETTDENITEGLGFIEKIHPGEILVVQGSLEYAYFGELMSRLSMRQGLGGVIIDGLTRDTAFTKNIPLPIFAKGYSPVDIKGRGRVRAVDIPISVGGITVNSGDYVFGDNDGVVVIPAAQHDTLHQKVEAAKTHEKHIITMINSGATVRELLSFTSGF